MGYKVFITAVNGQVSGLLSKYLAAATQNQTAASLSPTSPSGVSGVPGPHSGDLQRRKTEPALMNRNRTLSQHNSMPIAGVPDIVGTNSNVRRSAKVISPRNSTETPGSVDENGQDAVSTDGTEETEVEFGKAESGVGNCTSGASAVDKTKGHLPENNGVAGMVANSNLPNDEATEGQGCVVM